MVKTGLGTAPNKPARAIQCRPTRSLVSRTSKSTSWEKARCTQAHQQCARASVPASLVDAGRPPCAAAASRADLLLEQSSAAPGARRGPQAAGMPGRCLQARPFLTHSSLLSICVVTLRGTRSYIPAACANLDSTFLGTCQLLALPQQCSFATASTLQTPSPKFLKIEPVLTPGQRACEDCKLQWQWQRWLQLIARESRICPQKKLLVRACLAFLPTNCWRRPTGPRRSQTKEIRLLAPPPLSRRACILCIHPPAALSELLPPGVGRNAVQHGPQRNSRVYQSAPWRSYRSGVACSTLPTTALWQEAHAASLHRCTSRHQR